MIKRLKNWLGRFSIKKKLVVLVVVLVIGWLVWSKFLNVNQNQPQYQTAVAEKGTLIVSVSASGNISSANSASITTQASGIVNKVYVRDGDIVSAGQNIAEVTLDTASAQKQAAAWSGYLSAQNSLKSAQAKINSLQSSLFKANQAFMTDRGVQNPSNDQKADPKYIEENAEWLQAEADYKNQQGVINQAQASLNSSWLLYTQLSSTITAPIAGKVTGLTLIEGVPIGGNQTSTSTSSNGSTSSSSQSVGSIVLENSHIQATVNLTEIDVISVKPDQKVTLTLDAMPDKTFTGRVASVNTNGSVSSGVTNYPTTITFDTGLDNIYPNMGVNANIITNIKDNVILVPSAAVQTTTGVSTVRVMRGGQVTPVQVETGGSNDTQTEIVSGVNAGDEVVTGTTSTATTGQSGTSPFSSFGGNRGFGGGGGGGAIRINGR